MCRSGDLVFIRKNTLFSKVVAYFSKSKNESSTFATHVIGFYDDKYVIESSFITKRYIFKDSIINYDYEIWRNKYLRYDEVYDISECASKYVGRSYGYFKLICHFLDTFIEKLFGNTKSIYLFRRLIRSDKYPICSWIWAFSYFKIIKYKFGVDPEYASPDDMHDYVRNNEAWILIEKYTYKNNNGYFSKSSDK